jgi:CTP:molybdopterin cytidylyltransferase MocA
MNMISINFLNDGDRQEEKRLEQQRQRQAVVAVVTSIVKKGLALTAAAALSFSMGFLAGSVVASADQVHPHFVETI